MAAVSCCSDLVHIHTVEREHTKDSYPATARYRGALLLDIEQGEVSCSRAPLWHLQKEGGVL